LRFRRTELAVLICALVGAVFALDLIWTLVEGSTGALGYGFVDEPAHLATCAIALLAVAAALDSRLPVRFVVAALVASVVIDVDHIPGYLGWDGLAGALPRPYPHSLVLVAVFVALGCSSRRIDVRQVSLGLAFGVSAHLLRDLATGPGVPLAWPVSGVVVSVPYAFFAAALALAGALVAAPRRLPAGARLGLTGSLAVAALAGAMIVPAPAAARTVSIGAYISGADNHPSMIDDFNTQVGRQAAFVVTYKDWEQAPFVGEQLDGIWSHGAVPVVTWEPWTSSGGRVPLKLIARGAYDGYVADAARAAANWGEPLMVRFGQEMNGDWFPWGSRARAFKAAWRHLVGVFRRHGAHNVRWIWNPYVNSRGGRLPFTKYFPGGKWVDWVGLDVINWGGAFPWRTFRQIAARSYQELRKLTRKPMILAETGSGEQGGSKAHWLSTMLRRHIPRMRRIRAIAFWSENDPRGDLRVDSSSAALEALRNALSSSLYGSSRWALVKTPSRLGR
jgi:Glycosyl hydrolase family 26/LexA-binding, inner membrane-associated putative hydrolase